MALFGNDFDQVQVGGDFKVLPAGGYVCRIIKAKQTTSTDGLPMVEAMIDIVDGEYEKYFGNLYRSKQASDPTAKYPYNGICKVKAVDAEGHTKKLFKSFCTAIEQSNDMELPRHDDAFIKALNGKEIGVIFGREEYMGNDGKAHWSTKPRWYRSTENIYSGNYQVPDDQPLDPSVKADSFSAAEDDIPF